jgi:hypothetical protein
MRTMIVAACLMVTGCATGQAVRTCHAQAVRLDPDERATTQGHDRAQALMARCLEARGYLFNWNDRPCDADYPRTIVKPRCYTRSTP